jgi:hypothetical protein
MRVSSGGGRGGGSSESLIRKRHSIVNDTIKDRLVKIS